VINKKKLHSPLGIVVETEFQYIKSNNNNNVLFMTTMTISVHVYDYNGIVLHEMQPDIC